MIPAEIQKQSVQTSQGKIAHLETGTQDQPPVLFVHGIPTSSFLWRHVLSFLQADFHCYAPDLMGLGDTFVDPETAEFDMDGQAEMLLEFMSAMGHERFSIVCHDQGGAATQILATRQPERVTCLVLTNCVCYDNWPVPVIAFFQKMARIPLLFEALSVTGLHQWLETKTPFSAFRRGVYRRDRIGDAAIREYLRPGRQGRKRRESFKRFLLAGDPRYTMQVVPDLRQFQRPTLVLWAADDLFISPSWGKKLFEEIPGARRFELIPFCGHFWPEERPEAFAPLIAEFLREHAASSEADCP